MPDHLSDHSCIKHVLILLTIIKITILKLMSWVTSLQDHVCFETMTIRRASYDSKSMTHQMIFKVQNQSWHPNTCMLHMYCRSLSLCLGHFHSEPVLRNVAGRIFEDAAAAIVSAEALQIDQLISSFVEYTVMEIPKSQNKQHFWWQITRHLWCIKVYYQLLLGKILRVTSWFKSQQNTML